MKEKKISIPIEFSILLSAFLLLILFFEIDIKENNINMENIMQISLNSYEEQNNLKEIDIENTQTSIDKIASEREVGITSRSSKSREEADIKENVVEEDTNKEEVIDNIQETEILEENTVKIEDVKISKDMNLTIRTGLSKEDFITLISGVKADTSGFFEENAGLIYDVCEKYEINEIFFCGLISAESGWTIASNHRRTYNYISLMSKNGLIKFASVEDGMEKAAKTLHDKYLTPGGAFYYGPTLSGVKTKFCPASSSWTNLVYQRMEQIIK